jgi:hypothetical protein
MLPLILCMSVKCKTKKFYEKEILCLLRVLTFNYGVSTHHDVERSCDSVHCIGNSVLYVHSQNVPLLCMSHSKALNIGQENEAATSREIVYRHRNRHAIHCIL